jgi:hypothetical protein
MLRKLLFSTVALATMLVPAGLTAQANADWHREVEHHHRRAHYEVFYRNCGREPWALYRTAYSSCDANEIAARLRCRGLQAYVSFCR